ncbi:hypothetical protein GCM10020331_082890 [Ectobacillus funiculus]
MSCGLGMIETSNTFGKVLSPILGSILAAVVWFLPFWFIPILCAAAILLIAFLVKPPKQEPKKVPVKEFVHTVMETIRQKERWLLAIFILGAIIMFVLFGVQFYLSTLLEEKNIVLMAFGKVLFLLFRSQRYRYVPILQGRKIGDQKEDNEAVYTYWICNAGRSICNSFVFFHSIYMLVATLVIAGIGIGLSLPSLDAMITEGIEKGGARDGYFLIQLNEICWSRSWTSDLCFPDEGLGF